VTYGKAVSYTVSLQNSPGKSTYTHVFFHNPVPYTLTLNTNGTTTKNFASFKYSDCPGQVSSGEYVSSDLGQLSSGGTRTCVIVWGTPSVGSSDDPTTSADECAATQDAGGGALPTPPPCITNQPYWTIKEGTGKPGSAGPDTFFTNVVGAHFLATSDATDARGYEIDGCADVNGSGALSTGQLGTNNLFRATVCVGGASLPGKTQFPGSPGLVQTIHERPHQSGDGGFTDVAEICIPSPPGQSCTVPWPMNPPGTVKLEFNLSDTPTPTPSEKIDHILHDSGDGNGYIDVTAQCTLTTINRQGTKFLVAVCPAPTNGRWTGS
jgi:hypothetical protein